MTHKRMTHKERSMFRQPIRASIFDINPRAETLPLVSLTVLAILLAVVPVAQAQTYTVLHNFIGGADETNSQSGLTISPSGQLYGTTLGPQQCTAGCGTVYRISRAGTGWILSTLYAFRGGTRWQRSGRSRDHCGGWQLVRHDRKRWPAQRLLWIRLRYRLPYATAGHDLQKRDLSLDRDDALYLPELPQLESSWRRSCV